MKGMVAKESIEVKPLQVNPEGDNSAQLDSALGGLEGGSERVSEIVGEKANENKAAASKVKNAKKDDEDKALDNMSGEARKTVLPSVKVQKQKIRKVLVKKQKNLLKEMHQLEKSKNFSANKMEKLIVQLRKVHSLLNSLVSSAKENIQNLYEQLVLKKG